MTTSSQSGGEEGNPVRRLLRNLPHVSATPDFETQLQRRITQETSEGKSVFVRLFSPRRTPVFAYSLMSILLVGAISYYMLIRTGQAPNEIRTPILQELPKREQEPIPELRQGGAKQVPSKSDLRQRAESQDATQGVKVFKMAPPVRELDKQVNWGSEQKTKSIENNAGRASAQPSAPPSEINSNPSTSEPVAEEQRKGKDHAPTPAPAIEVPRSLQSQSRNSETTGIIDQVMLSDSLERTDSTRSDSVKRFQRQLLRQKQRKQPPY